MAAPFLKFKAGSSALICSADELEQILSCYDTDTLEGRSVYDIADQEVTVLWLPSFEDFNTWDGLIPVLLKDSSMVKLPFAALHELEHESEQEPEVIVIRDRVSESQMILNFAAETIQAAYRHYRACKPAMRIKRTTSEERLVMSLAADTIKDGFKSMKSKRMKQQQIVPSSSDAGIKRKKTSLGNIFGDDVSPESKGFAVTMPTIVLDDSDEEEAVLADIKSHPASPLEKIRASLSQTAPVKLQSPQLAPTPSSDAYLLIQDITFSHIVPVKWTKKCDPYVALTVGDNILETNIQWDSDSTVVWRDLHYYTPAASSLRIDIYDANVIREDVLMASVTCSVTGGRVKEKVIDSKGKYRGEIVIGSSLVDVKLPPDYVCEGYLNRLRRLQDKHKIITNTDTSLNIDRISNTDDRSDVKSAASDKAGVKRVEVPTPAPSGSKSREFSRRDSKEAKSAPKPTQPVVAPVVAEAKTVRSEPARKEVPVVTQAKYSARDIPREMDTKREYKREVSRAVDLPRQESKQISAASSRKSKKKSVSNASVGVLVGCSDVSPDAHRVIDQVFEAVLQSLAASITLTYFEVGMVFDALGAAIDLESLRAQWKSTLVLSLSSEKLFAAILTEFARDTLGDKLFIMTEDAARKALKHLNSLVQGPYKKFRKLVLDTAESINKRPYAWPTKILVKIVKALQFPLSKFEGSSMSAVLSSRDACEFDIVPSILQLRFQIYAAVLKRLDDLWLEGTFPKDLTYKKQLPVSTSETILRHVDKISDQETIQISSTDKLLKSYMPLNRAYGWGVTLEGISQLSLVLGGKVGRLSPGFGNVKMKGVRWVAVVDEDALNALRQLDMKPVSGRHVAVPISCIKAHTSNAKNKTEPIQLAADIQYTVGMNVQIAEADRLKSAYDRFEWWERPPEDVLLAFAGSIGEVVSVAQLADPHRLVGVRVMSGGTEIIDAVPVEALNVPMKKKTKSPVASGCVVNTNVLSAAASRPMQKTEAKSISRSQSLEKPHEESPDYMPDDFDMWMGGGDESAPPDPLSSQDIHSMLAPSVRIPSAPVISRNVVKDRPLYRPGDAEPQQKIVMDSYGWLNPKRIDASFDTDRTKNEQYSISPKQKRKIETPERKSPKLSITTAQFESDVTQPHRERSLKKHSEEPKKSSLLYAEDKLPDAELDEDGFGIEGFGLSASSRRKRPKSANTARKPAAGKERPKTAAAKQPKDSEPSAYAWLSRPIKPIKNVSDSLDPKINENLWRELRRSERDMHAKEVDIRRQLKKMGVGYNSTHT